MNTLVYILIILVLATFTVLLFLLLQFRKSQQKPQQDQAMQVMMEWVKEVKYNTDKTRVEIQKNNDQTRHELTKGIENTNRAINERLDNAAKVIGAVTRELGQMQQIGKSLSYVQEFLLSAKKRGTIGEQIMEEMIRQSLPAHMYTLQYRFQSGDIADSIVRINGRLLAMDSKFSMENYRAYINSETDENRDAARKAFVKDIKKRIDEINRKYILPVENTLDFALMYVPADGVFNEISDDVEIYEHARNKHVHMVSPSTFYYFLHVLLLGLQGARVNEQAEQILKTIQGIKQDSDKFNEAFSVLTKHVTNAKDTVDRVGTLYSRMNGKIDQISSLKLDQAPTLDTVVEEQLKQPVPFVD